MVRSSPLSQVQTTKLRTNLSFTRRFAPRLRTSSYAGDSPDPFNVRWFVPHHLPVVQLVHPSDGGGRRSPPPDPHLYTRGLISASLEFVCRVLRTCCACSVFACWPPTVPILVILVPRITRMGPFGAQQANMQAGGLAPGLRPGFLRKAFRLGNVGAILRIEIVVKSTAEGRNN